MKTLLLLVAALALVGCDDHWAEQHAAQCAAFKARATTASDSLHVDVSCALMVEMHGAKQAAQNAEAMSAFSAGAAAGAASGRR